MDALQDVVLDESKWGRVHSNLGCAKAHMRTILQLKTDYASRPPFLFCVSAHYSENVARAGAQRIIRALQDEPDESVHHRITIRFMRDVGFMVDLRRFADGHSRLELQSETLQEIAKLAFIPIAETTIEEKAFAGCSGFEAARAWTGPDFFVQPTAVVRADAPTGPAFPCQVCAVLWKGAAYRGHALASWLRRPS